MNWTLIRRVLVVAGCVYAFALVPASIRPQWTASPLRKPNQTISVVAGSGVLRARLKDACRAPALLRPLLGSAQKIRVISTDANGQVLSVQEYNCELYV